MLLLLLLLLAVGAISKGCDILINDDDTEFVLTIALLLFIVERFIHFMFVVIIESNRELFLSFVIIWLGYY